MAHPNVYARVGVEPGKPLPQYTSIGSYTILYFTKSGETMCAACATAEQDDSEDPVTYVDVYYEGPSEFCAGCNRELESSYGDPNENVNDTEDE